MTNLALPAPLRRVALALVTPLLEKNPVKALAVDAPLVFSMTRLVWLAFAGTVIWEIARSGIGGWPEATLAIAIVVAPPLLGALDHVQPREVLAFAQLLIGRFGTGDVRRLPALYSSPNGTSTEPLGRDNHRLDGAEPT
jgi:hypothetical protein